MVIERMFQVPNRSLGSCIWFWITRIREFYVWKQWALHPHSQVMHPEESKIKLAAYFNAVIFSRGKFMQFSIEAHGVQSLHDWIGSKLFFTQRKGLEK